MENTKVQHAGATRASSHPFPPSWHSPNIGCDACIAASNTAATTPSAAPAAAVVAPCKATTCSRIARAMKPPTIDVAMPAHGVVRSLRGDGMGWRRRLSVRETCDPTRHATQPDANVLLILLAQAQPQASEQGPVPEHTHARIPQRARTLMGRTSGRDSAGSRPSHAPDGPKEEVRDGGANKRPRHGSRRGRTGVDGQLATRNGAKSRWVRRCVCRRVPDFKRLAY